MYLSSSDETETLSIVHSGSFNHCLTLCCTINGSTRSQASGTCIAEITSLRKQNQKTLAIEKG